MRFIWAKLLTEEIKKPKSISRRTLDVVKNLLKDEAELFKEISISCVEKFILLDWDKKPIISEKCMYDDMLKLVDAGLINPACLGNSVMFSANNPSENFMGNTFGKKFLLFTSSRFTSFGVQLTTAGVELLEVIDLNLSPNQAISIARGDLFPELRGLDSTL